MRRTARRSSREKCKPTPNINSITPISASWLRKFDVGHEPRRGGTDDDACDQITDQSAATLDAAASKSDDQGQPQSRGDRGDQSYAMRHESLLPIYRQL